MKKSICLILSAALGLGALAGCAQKDVGTEPSVSQSVVEKKPTAGQEVTEPSVAPDGKLVFPEPEKVISVADLDVLTVTVATSSSYGVRRRITYALRDDGRALTLYERNTEADLAAKEFYGYESLCVVEGETVRMYSNQKISGTGFQLVDLSGEYDRDDGYLRAELANLGLDYQDHFTTDGFTKGEDTVYLGRDCYVYTLAYTDRSGAAYKAEIWVDQETGLWLRSQRSIPGTQDSFLMEVLSVEQSAAVIPGAVAAQVEPKTLYSKDGISLAVDGLDISDPDHAVVEMTIRNDTQVDVRLSSHYVEVNGLCIGGNLISHSCAANETQQVRLELPNASLDRAGIEELYQISTALWIEQVHVESDPQGDYIVADEILVRDTGALVIGVRDGVQTVDADGTVLVDDDRMRLVLTGVELEDSGDVWVGFYCEDRCAEPVRTSVYIKSIDGIGCDLQGRIVMQEHRQGFDGFKVSRQKLLELGVEDIETVELCIEAFLGESFMSSECILELTDPVTVTLQ